MEPQNNLPASGFLRLASILAPNGPIPVSKSTWWAGVKTGRFPRSVKLGPRITAWRVEDIRKLLAELGEEFVCSERQEGCLRPNVVLDTDRSSSECTDPKSELAREQHS